MLLLMSSELGPAVVTALGLRGRKIESSSASRNPPKIRRSCDSETRRFWKANQLTDPMVSISHSISEIQENWRDIEISSKFEIDFTEQTLLLRFQVSENLVAHCDSSCAPCRFFTKVPSPCG